MPGRPKTRAVVANIEENGGMAWITEQIANGGSLYHIAKALGCSRWLLYTWITKEPKRKEAYHEARKVGVSAKLEKGEHILDHVNPNQPAAVNKARAQMNYRQWLAQTLDRATYGSPDPQSGQVINIGTLHLNALMAHGGPPELAKETEEGGGDGEAHHNDQKPRQLSTGSTNHRTEDDQVILGGPQGEERVRRE